MKKFYKAIIGFTLLIYSFTPLDSVLSNELAVKKYISPATIASINYEKPSIAINTTLSKFYPKNSLMFGYTEFTEENLDKIKVFLENNIFNEEESKTEAENPSKKFNEILQIFKNLTMILGPDLCFGFLSQDKDQKEPNFLISLKIKSEDFSSDIFMKTFANNTKFESLETEYSKIYISKKDSNSYAFTIYKDNFLLSNFSDNIIQAIDNSKNSINDILTTDESQKALSKVSKNNLITILVNNRALANVFTNKKNKKASNLATKDKVQPEINTEEISEDEVQTNKPSSKRETKNDFVDKYLQEFISQDSFTALAINIKNNIIETTSFTPYNLDFISNVNPGMAEAIDKTLKGSESYNVFEALPEKTASFVVLSNINLVGNILKCIDDEKIKNEINMMKFAVTTFTGLDFDSEILPLFRGHTTFAMIENNLKPEFLMLIPNQINSNIILNKLFETLQKVEETMQIDTTKVKNILIKNIYGEKLPFSLAYATIKEKIGFGNFQTIENMAMNQENCQKTMSNNIDNIFTDDKNFNMAVFINFDIIKELFSNETKKFVPDEFSQNLKSILLTFKNMDQNIFSTKCIIQFKENKTSRDQ